MKKDLVSLATSFAELKKTASSAQDIVAWFQQHPEVLPRVPALLLDRVTVNWDKANSGFALGEIVEDPYYSMRLGYETLTFDNDLVEFYHVVGQLDRQTAPFSPNRDSFRDSICCPLPLSEWPCLVPMLVFDFLKHVDTWREPPRYESLWNAAFPRMSWTSVKQLAATGLLADNLDDFTRWALSTNDQAETPAVLPDAIPTTLN